MIAAVNATLRKLLALEPGTPQAQREKAQLEHAVFAALEEGIRGAERFVASLSRGGPGFAILKRRQGLRYWGAQLDGRRELLINAAIDRIGRMVWVQYNRIPEPPKLTPREARIDALQKAFYARYMEIGERAYATPPKRIDPLERTLLLVGELEGGVNNGGFSTYLFNKGRRRAKATVTALESIGARKTADMLRQAMAPGVTEKELDRLDTRFYRVPEDLALLAARKAKLGGTP